MVNNTVAAASWLTKPVRWKHVLPALAAAASVVALAVAAVTAVALAAAAVVAAVTAVALAAVAVAVAAGAAGTAVAVAATKHSSGITPTENERALVALFLFNRNLIHKNSQPGCRSSIRIPWFSGSPGKSL